MDSGIVSGLIGCTRHKKRDLLRLTWWMTTWPTSRGGDFRDEEVIT